MAAIFSDVNSSRKNLAQPLAHKSHILVITRPAHTCTHAQSVSCCSFPGSNLCQLANAGWSRLRGREKEREREEPRDGYTHMPTNFLYSRFIRLRFNTHSSFCDCLRESNGLILLFCLFLNLLRLRPVLGFGRTESSPKLEMIARINRDLSAADTIETGTHTEYGTHTTSTKEDPGSV